MAWGFRTYLAWPIALFGLTSGVGGMALAQGFDFYDVGSEIFPHPAASALSLDGAAMLSVQCDEDGEPIVTIFDCCALADPERPEAVTFDIDGQQIDAELTFRPEASLLFGPVSAELIAALKTGSGVTVTSEPFEPRDYSLSGSTVAINRTLGFCPLPAP